MPRPAIFFRWQCLLLLTACTPLFALSQPRHPVMWIGQPRLHTIPDSLAGEPAVFVLDEKDIQMQSGGPGAEFEQYYTTHRIIHLNDEKGTEAFNTFSIPVLPGTKLYELKARTILPGGKTVEVSRDKVKKIKSESGLPEYRIAMEAVERGAEVELLVTELLGGTATGSEIFQHRIPALEAIFRMTVPDHMRYDAKGYNGFPKLKDSVMGDERRYTAIATNIPALDEEPMSRYRSLLMRVDYKLSYVDRSGNAERRMSWGEMASELYRKYARFSSDERSAASDLVQQIGIKEDDSDAAKVTLIEDYFKTNISISNGLSDEQAADFRQIIKKRISTEKGYVRLFAACLRAAGIRYEIGKVGERFAYTLDDSLEMWDYLDEYCFYLPALKAYVAPSAITYRYPVLPYQLCGARGVFAKSVSVSDSAPRILPDFRTIPHPAMEANRSTVEAEAHFEGTDLLPVITTSLSFYGSSAGELRQAFLFGMKDKEREAAQGIVGLSEKPEELRSYEVSGTALNNYTTGKPLVIKATVQAPKLMEKAGSRYLFRIGALIGKQTELYNESKRRLPIEIEYPNEQVRTLRIAIPAGYKAANPDVLRTAAVCKVDGSELCGFNSDYRIDGSEIIVNVREYYARTSYPLSAYESYRKVVNAAADFNKITLVLQKR